MTDAESDDTRNAATRPWSKRIEAALKIELESSLAAWFDGEHWKRAGGNEFTEAIEPGVWLESVEDILWPGLMGCHLLPLIGNQIGDYLAVRVDDFGRASSIVHWYHGGGDWLPWGRNLAEALIVEARSDELPGSAIRHTGDAFPHQNNRSLNENPWYEFARDWYRVNQGWDPGAVEQLFASRVDTERQIGRVPTLIGLLAESPNHQEAIQWCDEAASYEPQMAWIWDSAGRISEAAGDRESAIAYFDRGARCSVFTSQSVRLNHHANEDQFPKYSLSRLVDLVPDQVREDPYLSRLAESDPANRYRQIYQHWQSIADSYPANHRAAVFALHMSAWDLGMTKIEDYSSVIDQIVDRCLKGGMEGRGKVAQMHQRAFASRWGVDPIVDDRSG